MNIGNGSANHVRIPNYNLSTPAHARYVLIAGTICAILGLILSQVMPANQRTLPNILLTIAIIAGVQAGILVLIVNNRSRRRARDTIMSAIPWRGDETVLDVGCGNGILLLAAAKRIPRGKAIGIDLWHDDAGGQTAEVLSKNAQLEGVQDRIEVREADARSMPFEDATFDIVMASLALHHMGNKHDRERAVREMVRVVKPAGTIVLYDMFPVINNAVHDMRRTEIVQVQRLSGILMRAVKIQKQK